MWRDYSRSCIKNNRASGMSIRVASFIAALFLSFLCCLFYNFWLDEINGIVLEEGDWQGRITGEIGEEELKMIRNHAEVEQATVNQELSEGADVVVDLRFSHASKIVRHMTEILELTGLPEDAAEYHYQLLSMYFIRIPGDEMPRMMMPLYLFIVLLVCGSMVLIICHSFAVSMDSRVRQFGIFSSIGATPGQIRVCLLQEAVGLSLAPVSAGILCGICLCFGVLKAMNRLTEQIAGGREASFQYHPLVLVLTLGASMFTVILSAWLPAWKLSRKTPLEAIRQTEELHLNKKKASRILTAFFGMEGELAGNALRAQKKALRVSSFSLTLSFLGFTLMQCMFTLSGISTDYTYFARYQDAWDVMVTIEDTELSDFSLLEQAQELPGARSSVIYQKKEAACMVPKGAVSEEVEALGGLPRLAGTSVSALEDGYEVKAPVVILDDAGFLAYCEQAGVQPGLSGAIVVNRIWDSIHSNFRYREYVPYIRASEEKMRLKVFGQETVPVEVPVLAYTQEYPLLREEYADYGLVQILPLSLWREVEGELNGLDSGQQVCIRILAEEGAGLSRLDALEKEAAELVGSVYELESENRIREKMINDQIIQGYELVTGSFCVLLAAIGIASVFSNTLGFLRQRKREFARYLSVGLTPEGMKKLFCIEALVIAGRPLLTTLFFTLVSMGLMIKASCLAPADFLVKAPVLPILLFALAVLGGVALAYYLGGKKIMNMNLSEALRDDTMM